MKSKVNFNCLDGANNLKSNKYNVYPCLHFSKAIKNNKLLHKENTICLRI